MMFLVPLLIGSKFETYPMLLSLNKIFGLIGHILKKTLHLKAIILTLLCFLKKVETTLKPIMILGINNLNKTHLIIPQILF